MMARVLPSPSSKKAIHSSMPLSAWRWIRCGAPVGVDAASLQGREGRADVVDGEVEDRAWPPLLLGHGSDEEPCAGGVEEGEVAEGEDMRQAERVAIEGLDAGDVARQQRDLAEGTESEVGGRRHGDAPPGQGAGGRVARPVAQGGDAGDPELAADVLDVVLDRIEADAAPLGDLRAGSCRGAACPAPTTRPGSGHPGSGGGHVDRRGMRAG